MPIELTAHTDAGARLVAIAEELAEVLAARAAEHDRDGTYPFEAIDALKAAGYFAAPVPVELGGLGVSSRARPRRGVEPPGARRRLRRDRREHAPRRRAQHGAPPPGRGRGRGRAPRPRLRLRRSSRSRATASCWPPRSASPDRTSRGRARVATRTEAGWRIDGRKMFCTMSPAATDLYVAVTYVDDEGTERYAYAMVPTDAPGVIVHDDWDALGMRASGSNSVTLDGVELPDSGVRGGFRAGDPLPYMERNLVAGLFHAAASLGIAESADADRPPRHRRAHQRRRPPAHADRRQRRRPRRRARHPLPRRHPHRRPTAPPTRPPTAAPRSSPRCSPRPRPPRRSSTRRPPASSIARSPSRAARATSTAARSPAPTATSRPAPSCTRSAPTAPTTTSAAPLSAKKPRCTEPAAQLRGVGDVAWPGLPGPCRARVDPDAVHVLRRERRGMLRRARCEGSDHAGTWPHAAKMPMLATSTEVVDWTFHCEPSVPYP